MRDDHDPDFADEDEGPDDLTANMFGDSPPAAPAAAAAAPSAYLVLARKYRPQTFEDLIGQEAMVRTLTSAFRTGRIAQAYMLTGVRGVGKTTTARLIARALNYVSDTVNAPSVSLDPPGRHCAAIAASRHPDVFEMDAASHTGVGDMRDILDGVRYGPIEARAKVYIIDEVHMLSTHAFNALLKTLEEPPPHAKFIFATTEIRKVPVTVLSRCQRFDLRRVEPDRLAAHLAGICAKEGVKVDAEGLALIARAAEGSVRDALSLLDQAIVLGGGTDTPVSGAQVRDMLGLADRSRVLDLLEAVMKPDAATALTELRAQYDAGADPSVILRDLLDATHDVARARVLGAQALGGPSDQSARLAALAERTTPASASRLWQLLLKGHEDAQRAPDALQCAEMTVIRAAAAAGLPPPEMAALIASGQAVPASASAATSTAAPSGGASASAITRLDDILDLLGEAREIGLKTEVSRYFRLVALEAGRITWVPAPGAPQDLGGRLAKFLKETTGDTWTLATPEGVTGGESARERADRERAEAIAAAEQLPEVQAALAAFPGAQVIDVTPPPAAVIDLNATRRQERTGT
jgi:DNA polymerase III subunit gamma/tau